MKRIPAPLPETEYIKERHPKRSIVWHHTVGGTALSSIEWWKRQPGRIATAFVIERNGDLYECFGPEFWAYHTGKGKAYDRASIGIELASEGPLVEHAGALYAFDRITPRTLHSTVSPENECTVYYDHGEEWRGWRYFDRFETAQVKTLVEITDELLNRFDIPRVTPANHYDASARWLSLPGVVGHNHLRADKSDLHPGFPWEYAVEELGLALV